MADLLGQNIGANYKGLLNIGSTINTPLDGTLRLISDGMGNNSPFQLSTLQVGILSVIARASGTNIDNPLSLAYTINNSGGTNTVTGFKLNATETAIVGTTHNLMDLQVGGVSKLSVSNAGQLFVTGNAYLRGSFAYLGTSTSLTFETRSQIFSTANGNLSLSNNAGTDFGRLLLGGSTSSFPAIKRNGAAIDFRLADDSNYCAITSGGFAINTTATLGNVNWNLSGGVVMETPTSVNIKSGLTGLSVLFANAVTSNVGIGTNAPTQILHVQDGSSVATTMSVKNAIGAGTGSSNSNILFSQADSYTTTIGQKAGGRFQIDTHGGINAVQIGGTLSVNTSTPLTATVGIKGSGSTSATTSLLVQNSSSVISLQITDNNLLCLGGTTSSFPAIKRNGAAIDFRLADDSNYCNITAGNITMIPTTGTYLTLGAAGDSGFITGSSGVLRIKSSGSLDMINVFGNFVGIMETSVIASAVFAIGSTTKGFLMPRMTTAQINAIATPANGLQVYNTDLAQPCFYDGSGWRKVSHTTM